MWEKRLVHEQLKAFRVVRGYTQEEVETKSRLQLAAWAERWQRKQASELAHQKQAAKQTAWEQQVYVDRRRKELALKRTLEAEAAIQAVRNILSNALATTGAFDWQGLRDSTQFSTPEPKVPTLVRLPEQPQRDDMRPFVSLPSGRNLPPHSITYLIGRLFSTIAEWVIPGLRRKRELEAQEKAKRRQDQADQTFAQAVSEWQKVTDLIKKGNQSAKGKYEEALKEWKQQKVDFEARQKTFNAAVDDLRKQYLSGCPEALTRYWTEIMNRASYPDSFPRDCTFSFRPVSGTLALDDELPNEQAVPRVKSVKYIANREAFQEVPLSEADFKRLYDDVLYQLCLQTIHDLFTSDGINVITNIVFNGWVRSIDKATGAEVHACVMSVQVKKDEFAAIDLAKVDLKACFRKLKGISGSKLVDLSPVKPIIALNTEDHRFVSSYGVADLLDSKTNLAAMDWLDFENLIRELFEKEFSQNGGQVKITQASRDGGVDAIAFDPDPIRGGKIVIQAKRYTNTVGVSAVRDLFGTVHNEGATKGILVTTSDYGPDAYEFAKDKPLTLLSGSELLYLLGKHGYQAKIDLKEAKAILGEADK